MRKSYFAIIALGALVIASCQKENSAVLPKVDSPVFTATLDEDTKTALDATGKKSEWRSGDAIRVLNGTNTTGCAAVYTTTNSGESATFTTDVKNFTGDAFIAMYPASKAEEAWWNDDYDQIVNKLSLKPEQEAVAGGYDPEAHIAVAYTETKTLDFLNAVSLLKFTCGSDNISEVCVYANAKATGGTGTESKNVLSGDFNFNTKTNEVITETGDDIPTNNYVKVTGTFVKGKTYYIACLPTTFTEGFTVEVVSLGNKEAAKTTSKKNYTLKRNTILNLGTVESTVETRPLYLDITNCWSQAPAKYDAWIWGDGMSGTWVDFKVANGNILKTTIPNNTKGIKIYRRAPSMPSYVNEDKDETRWNAVQVGITSTDNSITIKDWWVAEASTTIPTI